MNEFLPLTNHDEWEGALKASEKHPVIIFKHSSTCPISTGAHEEIEEFMEESDVPVYRLIVQDSRELSRDIADDMGIKHESPQVIILEEREPIFDASHYEITKSALEEAFEEE